MFKRFCFLVLFISFITSLSFASTSRSQSVGVSKKNVKKKHSFTIVLDAGHGGKDTGTASGVNKYKEKELTLKTTLLLRDVLRRYGHKVILTRSSDVYVPLERRASIANNVAGNIFVSIHYNYSVNVSANGIEVYYSDVGSNFKILESKKLGNDILKNVVDILGINSRGLKKANFVVIRDTDMPSVLVECGFLSNQEERDLLLSGDFQKFLSEGLGRGIVQFLKKLKI